MGTLWYEEPSGERLRDPSLDQLVGFMRRDEDYWGPYSPVGVLSWDLFARGVRDSQLLFVRHADLGWYFECGDAVTYNPQSNNDEDWIKHWAYGEPMFFRVACFVSQTLGEQVVAEFLETGSTAGVVSWARTEAVQPRQTPEQRREERRRNKRKR